MRNHRFLCVLAGCLALAAASLLAADEPVYDAWAWLVWGRELAHGGLDLSSGPSWKPLPVALTTALAAAGDGAPQLWLVLVRAAWLLSLALAAELAFALSAGWPRARRLAAGACAALGVLLLADDVTTWARQAAGGMSEPLLVALVLGAVRLALGGRLRAALVAGALAALVRPEAFVLLVPCLAWCWRAEPRTRPLVVAVALAVPALWLVPGLLASGGAAGAERAQRATSDPLEVLWRAWVAPLAVAWPLALLALRDGARTRVLAAGALGWIALVAAMAAFGFAGLPRFMAPATALVCVLGGVGLAGLASRRASRPGAVVLALAGAALAVTAAGLPGRIAELAHAWSSSARVSESHDRLRALARAVGRERLLVCGRLATSDVLVRTALAWQLRVPLAEVVSFGAPPRLSGAFVVGLQASPGLRADVRAAAVPVARVAEWSVYSIDCPATASASAPARDAGVSGATR